MRTGTRDDRRILAPRIPQHRDRVAADRHRRHDVRDHLRATEDAAIARRRRVVTAGAARPVVTAGAVRTSARDDRRVLARRVAQHRDRVPTDRHRSHDIRDHLRAAEDAAIARRRRVVTAGAARPVVTAGAVRTSARDDRRVLAPRIPQHRDRVAADRHRRDDIRDHLRAAQDAAIPRRRRVVTRAVRTGARDDGRVLARRVAAHRDRVPTDRHRRHDLGDHLRATEDAAIPRRRRVIAARTARAVVAGTAGAAARDDRRILARRVTQHAHRVPTDRHRCFDIGDHLRAAEDAAIPRRRRVIAARTVVAGTAGPGAGDDRRVLARRITAHRDRIAADGHRSHDIRDHLRAAQDAAIPRRRRVIAA